MTDVVRLLGRDGVVATLESLTEENATALPRVLLANRFLENGLSDGEVIIDECLQANLIEPYGGRFGISNFGRRSLLLLSALEGGDVRQLFRRLESVSGVRAQYELVRQGMTGDFFESLVDRPSAARLYFCSPWIHPHKREAAILKHTVLQCQRRRRPVDVIVLTRPPEEMPPGTEDGLICFKDIGAQIYLNRNLHSKLYIREPDANGGMSMAIVGSQNLTRSSHLELGIRINGDGSLIDNLISYFWEVTAFSSEHGN